MSQYTINNHAGVVSHMTDHAKIHDSTLTEGNLVDFCLLLEANIFQFKINLAYMQLRSIRSIWLYHHHHHYYYH